MIFTYMFFFSSRRRHTRCALVTEFRRVLFRSIGARTARVAQQMTQGSISTTGNTLDLAISGEGFFTLSDNGAIVYSRAGAFGRSEERRVGKECGRTCRSRWAQFH